MQPFGIGAQQIWGLHTTSPGRENICRCQTCSQECVRAFRFEKNGEPRQTTWQEKRFSGRDVMDACHRVHMLNRRKHVTARHTLLTFSEKTLCHRSLLGSVWFIKQTDNLHQREKLFTIHTVMKTSSSGWFGNHDIEWLHCLQYPQESAAQCRSQLWRQSPPKSSNSNNVLHLQPVPGLILYKKNCCL